MFELWPPYGWELSTPDRYSAKEEEYYCAVVELTFVNGENMSISHSFNKF